MRELLSQLIEQLRRRIRALTQSTSIDRELDEELRFHIEAETTELMQRHGLPESEARRRVLAAFGGVAQTREAHREARGFPILEAIARDVHYAARGLCSAKVFSISTIAALAIGIGATTAAFALVDAVFLTALPVQAQDRLVSLWASKAPNTVPYIPWGVQNQLRERHGAFAGVAAYWLNADPYAARYQNRVLHLTRVPVSGPFFDVLGVRPAGGRLIHPDDDVVGASDVVVLSDALWRREFGADPQVVGQTLFFDGTSFRIIGIAPPQFWFPGTTEAWIPLVPQIHRWGISLDKVWTPLVARLEPGATLSSALTELRFALRAASATGKYGPQDNIYKADLQTTGAVEGYAEAVLGPEVRPAVMLLFGAVALVLVIACANVAGLLLARGITRLPEVSVRTALGASRRQLVRYALTESALLALVGSVLGLALAKALMRGVLALAPPDLPMIDTAHLDLRVLAFAAAITVGSVLSFGVAPALSETRLDPQHILRTGIRSLTRGPVAGVTRRGLVAAQVAVALVILCGAGVLTSAIYQLQHVPLGFDPSNLLFFKVDAVAPGSRIHGIETFPVRFNALRDRIVQDFPRIAGLGQVSTAWQLPFSGSPSVPYTVDGRLPTKGALGRLTLVEEGLDDYFGVMRIPLLSGRAFTRHDDRHAPTVVVVNQSFAHETWPGQDPIGHLVRVESDSVERFWTVIGVAADDRFADLASPPRPIIYFPSRQQSWDDDWLVVRTAGNPDRAERLVDRTIASMDPMFGIRSIATGPELLRARLARPRALATVLMALAGAALLLVALGLFGVLSAYVRERRHEMAVRSALGATPTQLRSLVMTQTLIMATVGIACGGPFAALGPRLLHSIVSDAGSVDAETALVIAFLLLLVVGAAAYGPMVRATHIDAHTALATD